MISIINHYTVGDFLDEYNNDLQDALREYCNYYVEDGQIKLSKGTVIDMIRSLI